MAPKKKLKPEVVKPVKKESKEAKEVKEVAEQAVNCKACSHSSEKHYGTKDRWCNENNCNCQALQK
jgi:hypothetical protein